MKKIFVYVGSGRSECSHTLVYIKKIVSQVRKAFPGDLTINIFSPKNSTIRHCQGCLTCFYRGKCPFDKIDDMKLLKEEMLTSDIVIFGSPIYGANVSGDTKVFFDRISYWYHLLALRGKSALFILTSCGNGVHFSLSYASFIMRFLGLHIIDLYNINVYSSEQLSVDETILKKIEETASEIVSYLREAKKAESCESLESVFLSMKTYIEKLKNTRSAEYIYWQENGLLECHSFSEVLQKAKINL